MSERKRKDSDYLVRSEKRPNSRTRAAARHRKSVFLNILSIVVSILIWPIGMVLIWIKRNRMYTSTKVLLSMITLILCVLLWGFLLNQPFNNEKIDKIQADANEYLDVVYGKALLVIDDCVDGWGKGTAALVDLYDAAGDVVLHYTPDTLDDIAAFGTEANAWVKQAWKDTSEWCVKTWDHFFGDKEGQPEEPVPEVTDDTQNATDDVEGEPEETAPVLIVPAETEAEPTAKPTPFVYIANPTAASSGEGAGE